MSPFNSLRRGTRALGARALAGVALFSALAIALIALTAGLLPNAQATETGAPAQAADPAVAPEPVLGAEQVAAAPAPVATPPAPEPPAPKPAAPPESAPLQPESAPPADSAAPPAADARVLSAPQNEKAGGPADGDDDSGEEQSDSDDSAPGNSDHGESDGGRWNSAPGNSDHGESDRGRWTRDEEPIEEPTPDDESQESDSDDQDDDSENRGQTGERRGLGRRNLTGALGSLGAGAKEGGSTGGRGLNSLGGGSQDGATAPQQPSSDELPISDETGSGGSSPPGSETPPQPGLGDSAQGSSEKVRGSTPGDTLVGEGGSTAGNGGGGTVGTTPFGTGATPSTGTTTGTDVAEGFVPAPAVSGQAFSDEVGQSRGGGDGSANPIDKRRHDDNPGEGVASIIRQPLQVVDHVPDALKYALAALAALAVMLGVGYLLTAMRARSLGRQRRELLQEVGLLQSALLPPVPEKLGSLRTSVAYRPADGPGAGGDFYDVLPLVGGSVGFILGDVSGHGRGALARTAFMRYTLRAYLEAGLEPRAALQVAGRVIDENLGGDFATVLLAVHDPETGSLTYATAGHPAPIVVGPETHHPVTAGSSPPIGVGVPTGLRQTTVPLVPGAVACLFTDGLMDARVAGGILGRGRLEEMLREMGDDASARQLIDRVSQESRLLSDDIAAVVVSPVDGAAAAPMFRTEQLELSPRELEGPIAHRFLESCGVPHADAEATVEKARSVAATSGAVILDVVFGDNLRVDVRPRDLDNIEAASRRAATS